MPVRPEKLDAPLERVTNLLSSLLPHLPAVRRSAVERWRADAEALRFHVASSVRRPNRPAVVVLLGGTGTGKSTLTNRLLGRTITAASFRRTFTAGPVAIVRSEKDLPEGWLGVERDFVDPANLPARGVAGRLVVALVPASLADGETGRRGEGETGSALTPAVPTLVDTPDLDGDQPAHHAQADRAFRWAEAIVFLVTPEKYQMTEMVPYYRLARRYAVPAVYVMNKCEEEAVLDDFAGQLATGPLSARDGNSAVDVEPAVFAIPRDDAAYEPPPKSGLAALRAVLGNIPAYDAVSRTAGLSNRAGDVLGRLEDQVLSPLRDDRREADRLIAALRASESPTTEIDVNPVTQQLQRRLRQRSILYLMGPQRILDRVRQAPTLLARLPRYAWDYLSKGQLSGELLNPAKGDKADEVPEFRTVLIDQFAVLQSRIDDILRSTPTGTQWVDADPAGERNYAAARINPAEAGKIADEELNDLRKWLEQKWNATPRDTKMLETFLKYLPGGKKLSRWTEAAPYLLTIVLVTHHAVFGHVDLMVLGGYTVFTWITERLSNEVTARTRAANVAIETRFAKLAHEQLERVCQWVDRQAVSGKTVAELEKLADGLDRLMDRN